MTKINCILTQIHCWNYIVFTYKDIKDLNRIEVKSVVDLHNNSKYPISIWVDTDILSNIYDINCKINLADGKHFMNSKTKHINTNDIIDIINTISICKSFNSLIDKEQLIFLFKTVMFN